MKLFRPLPEIFLLGAMRAGTTFLHAALERHPHVAAARRKELHFFSHGWSAGMDAYRSLLPVRWPGGVYRATGQGRPIVVDSSPYYLFHPDGPQRLASTVAKPLCIVLLREPGARAWSHYQHMLGLGWEHLGFREALRQESDRVARDERFPQLDPHWSGHALFSYAQRGFYLRQLQEWWKHVPREQFLLIRSEDMFADPQGWYDRVCAFAGLSPHPLPADLPRNARSSNSMPADVRRHLNTLYAEPNRLLYASTAIGWEPQSQDISICGGS